MAGAARAVSRTSRAGGIELPSDNVGLQAQITHLFAILRQRAASDRHRHGERERLFSAVVESSNDAIITKTLGGVITGCSCSRRGGERGAPPEKRIYAEIAGAVASIRRRRTHRTANASEINWRKR